MIMLQATEREIQALANLIDAGVRASGVRGAGDAVIWMMKLDEAVKKYRELNGGEVTEGVGPRVSSN